MSGKYFNSLVHIFFTIRYFLFVLLFVLCESVITDQLGKNVFIATNSLYFLSS